MRNNYNVSFRAHSRSSAVRLERDSISWVHRRQRIVTCSLLRSSGSSERTTCTVLSADRKCFLYRTMRTLSEIRWRKIGQALADQCRHLTLKSTSRRIGDRSTFAEDDPDGYDVVKLSSAGSFWTDCMRAVQGLSSLQMIRTLQNSSPNSECSMYSAI